MVAVSYTFEQPEKAHPKPEPCLLNPINFQSGFVVLINLQPGRAKRRALKDDDGGPC